jgi:hypothetical protein
VAQPVTVSRVAAAADTYVRRWFPRRCPARPRLRTRLGETYYREVAEYYERAPGLVRDSRLAQLYDLLKQENLKQYRAVLDAAIEVVPWLGEGPPYRSHRHLIEHVCATGTLYVYLTRTGFGPAPGTGDHPMQAPAGISARGVELCHNDVFRVVHDAFGHVLLGNSFDIRDEFAATYAHLGMYPEEVLPVLFTEQIGQICWFFCGPHLADRTGRLRKPGDPAYLPPPKRPYPEQKVFLFPQRFVDEFVKSFCEEPR